MSTGTLDTESLITKKGDGKKKYKTYPIKWLVLIIATIAIAMRGYNQSCFGPINNIYTHYYHVEPWQVDWFVVIQSVVFLIASLPLTVLTIRMNYRLSMLLIMSTLTLGFTLTLGGSSTRSGFALVLCGQAIMGFSNILSWSIPPATAAVWFPSNQVATAVAIQVVGRGVGEAVGSILPSSLLKQQATGNQIGNFLPLMFGVLAGISFTLFLLTLSFVSKTPKSPPSEAQAISLELSRGNENLQRNFRETIKEFLATVKLLFADKVFVVVWLTFGAVNPTLRNNNVLLSSMLNKRFPNDETIDSKVGLILFIAWLLYTVGGFIAGPIITSTKRYKEIVAISVSIMCVSCAMVLAGIQIGDLNVVFSGVMIQGLFLGIINTSLYELLIEITYPAPTMFVTMVNISTMGLFRLFYPLLGRLLLSEVNATAASAITLVTNFICAVAVSSIQPTYKREQANASRTFQSVQSLESDSDSN